MQIALYDSLWAARRLGVEALRSALETSVSVDLPRTRDDVLAQLHASHFIDRSAPEREVRTLSVYRHFMPLPYDNDVVARLFLRDRFAVYGAGGLVPGLAHALGWATSWPQVAAAFAATLTIGLVVANTAHEERNAHNQGLLRDWLKPGSPAPDTAIFIAGAYDAAFDGDRLHETHCLTLAAGRSYRIGSQDSAAGETERRRLAMMARLRGSHHAAHALWMIREETGLSKGCDLRRWPYDALMVWRSLGGDEVAIETVNLAVRESEDFRENYIADMNRRGHTARDDVNFKAALEARP